MSTEDQSKVVSMAYTFHCLQEGIAPEPDSAKPLTDYQFPDSADFLEPLLLALQCGQVRATGRFSDVRLDRPEFEVNISSHDLVSVGKDWRRREDIILGIGSESTRSGIPSSAWWLEGAIWEKSMLWVADPGQFDDARRKSLKIERTVPYLPERPYSFEQLVCFDEVKFSLADILAWKDDTFRVPKPAKSRNERNAGAKPAEDWPKIEEFIRAEIENGHVWESWDDLWFCLQPLLNDPDSAKDSPQPFRKLEKRLRDHSPELLEVLRSNIRTSGRRSK